MNKEWYSASELAGFPGMPGTVQNVNARAKRENWECRKRASRGGGKEYRITSLPEITRLALIADTIHPQSSVLSREKTHKKKPHRNTLNRTALKRLSRELSSMAERHEATAEQFRQIAAALMAAGGGDE